MDGDGGCDVGCKSWVWHSKSKECYLKQNFDHRRSKEKKCDDCVAFSATGELYVYDASGSGSGGGASGGGQSESSHGGGGYRSYHKTTTTTTETTYTVEWEKGFFGHGVGFREATTADASNKCVFATGFDQPSEFNLIPQPLTLDTALMCCSSCNQNDRKCLENDTGRRDSDGLFWQNASHGYGKLRQNSAS